MSYTKHEFQSGEKLYASELNEMDEQIYKNTEDIDTIKKELELITDKNTNLINFEEISIGYLGTGGAVVESSSYITTGFIPYSSGTSIVKCIGSSPNLGAATKLFYFYDSNKQYIGLVYGDSLDEENSWFKCSFINTEVRYVRISAEKSAQDEFYLGIGSEIPSIEEEVSYGSPLYKKNWYVLGDSATEGDFSSIEQENLTTGKYAGKKPVYPYFIGNRTGVNVYNLGKCGGVISTIEDQPDRYQLSKEGVYNTIIGEDADIITIWFGANDMWQNVPIGTIDSTDATTLYGAWNKVLTYYINNFPKAKIGIVASFWCTKDYAEAVIAIGAKYGIPVLNLYNDPKIPVTVGSQRPDVSSSVKSLRNRQWTVSETNTHPSAEYHEIESYFIENWLMSL